MCGILLVAHCKVDTRECCLHGTQVEVNLTVEHIVAVAFMAVLVGKQKLGLMKVVEDMLIVLLKALEIGGDEREIGCVWYTIGGRVHGVLLSEEAQNDPTKRSEMILQIVRSIAIIPDIIKRQVYIKDTATLLSLPEDVLIRKVNEIRKQEATEQKKKNENEQRKRAETTDISSMGTPIDSNTATTVLPTLSHKERNILNLLQVIVRYGEKVIYQTEDDQPICAGEYIIYEMRNDYIEVSNPLHQRIMDEFLANYRTNGFVASIFFQHHPDVAISQLAVDMIADKYQLSRIYSKKTISENIVQEVQQDETDVLPELVQRLLLELKYTVVDERIDAMQIMLKEAQERNDWPLITTILEQQPQLMEIRQQLCRALGNRVIVR